MPPTTLRPLSALKGRDLRALQGFRDRVRAALGKSLGRVAFLSRRPIDVPADAAAPRPKEPPPAPTGKAAIGMALQPQPEPPGELRVALRIDRRDAWVEERVDALALEVCLETGALISPILVAVEELESGPARASRFAVELAAAEDI